MKWYSIDKKYADYLRKYCPNVPFTNYGPNKMKCFLGILLDVHNMKYFAPLTHWKTNYKNKNNNKTFVKIYDPKSNTNLSAINLLYMFPVPDGKFTEVTKKNIGSFRNFKTEKDKYKYWALLKKEINLLDETKITNLAQNLYNEITINRKEELLKIGIDFTVAEQKAKEYIQLLTKNISISKNPKITKKEPLDLRKAQDKANEHNKKLKKGVASLDKKSQHKKINRKPGSDDPGDR